MSRPNVGTIAGSPSSYGRFNVPPRPDRPAKERHLIADVRYRWAREHGLPSYRAPITCTCGWTGLAGGFPEHRLANGVRVGES